MNEFYITLLSDSSFSTFPNNTLSSFQSLLPQPINLESDNWLVGLAEISYPTGVDSINVPVQFDDVKNYNVLLLHGFFRVQFKVGIYESGVNLYQKIYQEVNKIADTVLMEYFLTELQKVLNSHYREIQYYKLSGKQWKPVSVTVKAHKLYLNTIMDSRFSTIYFPARIYNGVGDLINTIKNNTADLNVLETLNREVYAEVVKDLNQLRLKHSFTIAQPYYQMDTEPIFIYSDIVEPQIVGNVYAKCLRVIQFPLSSGYHIFNSPYYLPVEKTSFQSIGIQLLNKFGEHALFSNSISPCIVVLHFKRK